MSTGLKAGGRVIAAARITEKNFAGKAEHVHAMPGDEGLIRAADGEWLTVTWHPSGTTTDCHAEDVVPIVDTNSGRSTARGVST